MFTKAELIDAINELTDGKHTIQNCERLAAIYTVLDHLYPSDEPIMMSYSGDTAGPSEDAKVGRHGDSEFLRAISTKDNHEAWLLMEELMETLSVINPRLYDGVMRKI